MGNRRKNVHTRKKALSLGREVCVMPPPPTCPENSFLTLGGECSPESSSEVLLPQEASGSLREYASAHQALKDWGLWWLLLQRWLLEPSTCHCRASEGDTEDFHQAPQITCLAGNIWEILLCDFSQPVDKGGKCVWKSLESEPYQFKNFFSFINLFWKLFPIWKLPCS